MRQWITALAALVMLAAACGGDPTPTDTTTPEATIERPPVNTQAPPPPPTTAPREEPPTASEDETETTVVPDPETTTTTHAGECPEGTEPIEGGGCLHIPEEPPTDEHVVIEDAETQRDCEASGRVWDPDKSTCVPTGTEIEEVPGAEPDSDEDSETVGEEPVSTEDGAETEAPAAPAVPTVGDFSGQTGPRVAEIPTLLTHGPEEVIWWYPNLMRDGYDLIDPDSVEAVSWESYSMAHERLVPLHDYYVFYYADDVIALRNAWKRAAHDFWAHQWLYFPVRYDVSRMDGGRISVVGAWPLGEVREVVIRSNGSYEKSTRDDLPLPPPVAPLPPFTEADYPEHAEALGRGCASVEDLWAEDEPVQDECTLMALQNAVQYAVAAGSNDQTESAIRDGWAVRDVIELRRDIRATDPLGLAAYWQNPDNPGHRIVELRNVKWAGTFAGASLVHLEFRAYREPRKADAWVQEQLRELVREALEAGRNVPDMWLGDELPEDTGGWWDNTLMVRTADGTWRFSFSYWCRKMESTTFDGVEGKPLRCPDDPNPVWSDDLFDDGLFRPSLGVYWRLATEPQRQYYGQPPS